MVSFCLSVLSWWEIRKSELSHFVSRFTHSDKPTLSTLPLYKKICIKRSFSKMKYEMETLFSSLIWPPRSARHWSSTSPAKLEFNHPVAKMGWKWVVGEKKNTIRSSVRHVALPFWSKMKKAEFQSNFTQDENKMEQNSMWKFRCGFSIFIHYFSLLKSLFSIISDKHKKTDHRKNF